METHRLLYQAAPSEVRSTYGEVVKARSWSDKHSGLLTLAEDALVFCASMALSDYRSRAATPSETVEAILNHARTRHLTLGRALELFQTSVAAIDGPIFVDPRSEPAARLEAVDALVAAMAAIQSAVAGLQARASPSVIDVGRLAQRAAGNGACDSWWEGWRHVVRYRNKIAHAGRERWPVNSEGYCDVMGPLLHDALVELLTHPSALPVCDYPVVTVTLIAQHADGQFVHSVCGEREGVWFTDDVVATMPVTARWTEEHWKATEASSFILEPAPGDRSAFRALFWNLRDSPPPAISGLPGPSDPEAPAPSGKLLASRSVTREGRGTAVGTCGEFIQGVLPDGTPFHVTCPINKSATVIAQVRPAPKFEVTGLLDHHRKLGLAIEYAAELLDVGSASVAIRHWSDLDIGKGMGSSTADVLAAVRALANAVGGTLDACEEGALAARVESSDGTMHPGIAVVNHRTCRKVREWTWFPEFAIVMLVPHDSVDTDSISFVGQEALATDYAELLAHMDDAVAKRDIAAFAAQATASASLNDRFQLNPYARALSERLDEFQALGVNVGHTGTVCGLLFPNTDAGRVHASSACFEVRRQFPELKDVKVVTTPHWSPPPLLRAGEAG
jgi:L-threonine kinase